MLHQVDIWYIEGSHWTRCEIVGKLLGGVVTVRLYNEVDTRKGRARPGWDGNTLVDAKN